MVTPWTLRYSFWFLSHHSADCHPHVLLCKYLFLYHIILQMVDGCIVQLSFNFIYQIFNTLSHQQSHFKRWVNIKYSVKQNLPKPLYYQGLWPVSYSNTAKKKITQFPVLDRGEYFAVFQKNSFWIVVISYRFGGWFFSMNSLIWRWPSLKVLMYGHNCTIQYL